MTKNSDTFGGKIRHGIVVTNHDNNDKKLHNHEKCTTLNTGDPRMVRI